MMNILRLIAKLPYKFNLLMPGLSMTYNQLGQYVDVTMWQNTQLRTLNGPGSRNDLTDSGISSNPFISFSSSNSASSLAISSVSTAIRKQLFPVRRYFYYIAGT